MHLISSAFLLIILLDWPKFMHSLLHFSLLRPRKLVGSRNLGISRLFSTANNIASTDIWSYPLPSNEALHKTRHTTAHVMAMAVQKLFPKVKVTIGPTVDKGFYYDFYNAESSISIEDFKKIKKEMDKIIKLNLPITRKELSYDEAKDMILKQEEPYKLEILNSIKDSPPISVYYIGDKWWDLCAGPHLESTGQLNSSAIELLSIAGAYWRGDEKNVMLQRIYGTSWETEEQLQIYKAQIEDAKRRDHRVIGKQLNLFSIQEDAGGGLVFWHSKGSIIRKLIEDYWKEQHIQNGYQLLHTPHIANLNLWKTSGHVDFYKDDMFRTIEVDTEQYQLKPMNCPFHCLLYKDTPRSYRDLPIRWAELGTVYRYERSGALHGLFRVRGFTQDDAHIFCLPEQLQSEIINVLNLTEKILTKFGFLKFEIMLSTRPKESVGSNEIWEKATNALIGALQEKQWNYSIDEGGGAFYGPKIDIKIKDAIGRYWQCSTIQCDFNLPERFDLQYKGSEHAASSSHTTTTDSHSSKHDDKNNALSQTQSIHHHQILRPIMVHRAIFGSLERFFGVLIESTAGDFPLWLSPEQIRILPIVNDEHVIHYCYDIKKQAETLNIRTSVDMSNNRITKLIRNAENDKIPIVLVIGKNETQNHTVSLRLRKIGDVGTGLITKDVLSKIKQAIDDNAEVHKETFSAL